MKDLEKDETPPSIEPDNPLEEPGHKVAARYKHLFPRGLPKGVIPKVEKIAAVSPEQVRDDLPFYTGLRAHTSRGGIKRPSGANGPNTSHRNEH